MTAFTDHARNDAIYARRVAGDTFAAIAQQFGVSVERVRQIVLQSHHRHQLLTLGLNARAWHILVNMGLVQLDEVDTLTRDALRARLADVDLAAIGARKNCGLDTLRKLATLLERPLPVRPPKKPREVRPTTATGFQPGGYVFIIRRRAPGVM